MPRWYHRASWGLLRTLYAPSLLRRCEVEARGLEGLPAPPFILLADHANALDAYVLGSLAKAPIRYMANIEGVHPLKAAFAELIGAYGRRKGANDMAALRKTFELSRSGEAIGLFPEGDRSWDGSSSPIRPGVGKLVKRLGVPLVLARQKGNYLARPRWASRPRRGSWSVEFLTFASDELARMSESLVDAIIAEAMAKNEIKEAIREGRLFAGDDGAEGIGRLIWQCPVCGRTDTIGGRGSVARCEHCGARWEIDANCRAIPLNVSRSLLAADIGDLKDWHDWQVSALPALASESGRGRPGLRSEGVVLSRKEGPIARRIGRGRIFLTGEGRGAELVFEGPDARETFEASAVRGFVDNFNDFSEFDHLGQRWRLDFGGGNAAKWAFALSGGLLGLDRGGAA